MASDAGNPDHSPTRDDEPPDSDPALVLRSCAGDESAFAALFHRHYSSIRGLAARLLLDLSLAEDVAQETFLRAARNLDQLTDPQGVRSWLFRITANLCRDYHRSGTRRATRERDFSALCEPAQDEQNRRLDHIPAALAQLPSAHREAIVLVFYENLSHAQAARILGCAVSTTSWRIMLAKRKLKTLLDP